MNPVSVTEPKAGTTTAPEAETVRLSERGSRTVRRITEVSNVLFL